MGVPASVCVQSPFVPSTQAIPDLDFTGAIQNVLLSFVLIKPIRETDPMSAPPVTFAGFGEKDRGAFCFNLLRAEACREFLPSR